MIDIENVVFNTVSNSILNEFPNASIYGESVEVPASFPCVCIVEEDNYTYRDSQDTSLSENHSNLMYSVNVYSNKKNGKKTEAKKILGLVDETMQGMMFTRILKSPMPNVDRSIYRISARYTAVVERGKEINGNIVFQMYRK